MRMRLGMSCAALCAMSLAFTACGGDDDAPINDDDGDGAGGEKPIDSEIDDLKAEIERLEALIKDGEGNQADLEKELEDAKDRLEDLETCNSGGSCEGLEETKGQLSTLSDAYCEWLFGCCESEEVRASVAPHFSGVDECKSTYGDMINRGYASFDFNLEGAAYGFGSEIASMLEEASMRADSLQKGHIKIDEDNLAECVAFVAAFQCGDVEAEAGSACAASPVPDACHAIYVGVQAEGEACDNYYFNSDCEEGLICGYGAGYSQGICIPEPEEDDPCVNEYDCNRQDYSLYCDEGAGKCATKPGKDDDCQFVDPQFELNGNELLVPCQEGLECSPRTSTCVEPCEEDSYCYLYNEECGHGLKCQVTPYTGSMLGSYYGHCGPGADKGEERNFAEECESGTLYYNADEAVYVCTGMGGETCDVAGECASGLCDTTCATYCGGDFEDACAADEVCSNGACIELVANSGECTADEQCESGICHELVCSVKVARGGDCDADQDLCAAADFCAYTGLNTSGYSCVKVPKLGESCADYGQCPAGAFCDDQDETCQPDYNRSNGASCSSQWYECASERCDYEEGVCVDGSKEAGDDCSVEHPAGGLVAHFVPAWDECEKGLFCQRNAPGDDTDFTGVCTAQLEEGALCDRSQGSQVAQCVGNQTCSSTGNHGRYVCPVIYNEEDEDLACLLNSVPSYFTPWYEGNAVKFIDLN